MTLEKGEYERLAVGNTEIVLVNKITRGRRARLRPTLNFDSSSNRGDIEFFISLTDNKLSEELDVKAYDNNGNKFLDDETEKFNVNYNYEEKLSDYNIITSDEAVGLDQDMTPTDYREGSGPIMIVFGKDYSPPSDWLDKLESDKEWDAKVTKEIEDSYCKGSTAKAVVQVENRKLFGNFQGTLLVGSFIKDDVVNEVELNVADVKEIEAEVEIPDSAGGQDVSIMQLAIEE